MTIRSGESGKEFIYATYIDLSAFTELTLNFTGPNGETLQKTTADGVTAPSVSADTPLGELDADTYMQYTYLATDFANTTGDDSETWSVCGIYTNSGSTPDDIFMGQHSTFEVLKGC